MTTPDTTQLRLGLDQFARLAELVDDDNEGGATPCPDWTVGELVDHVIGSTTNFAKGLRGEEVDWSTAGAPPDEDRATAFRGRADDLVEAWAAAGDTHEGPGQDWQLAELAVHTWDLATALGQSTDSLDQDAAASGLAFMEANLRDEMRSHAFGPRQDAPESANAYERIAAFAGRQV